METFKLEAPPNELWDSARLAREFDVAETTIHNWSRSGRLPRAWVHRKGYKLLWAPETIWPYLERYRRHAGK